MLTVLFPKSFQKYSSLSILGPVADGLTSWLADRGYTVESRRHVVRMLPRIDERLLRCGVQDLKEISQTHLDTCRKNLMRGFPREAGGVRVVEGYLYSRGLVKPAESPMATKAGSYLAAYGDYLRAARGLVAATIRHHFYTASAFLAHVDIEAHPDRLRSLTAARLEPFVKQNGQRLTRASLQHTVAELRGFLRFLATRGDVPPGLDNQIDTPRLYRQEQLPRSLPWETVRSFLQCIDRSNRTGLRDFTMFLLIATYGLRASDIVILTLDDIHWRTGTITIPQTKTGVPLALPLTDEVGTALLRYLRKLSPPPPYRRLFLRMKAPIGVLKPTAVTEAFQTWSRRSGLEIPFQGPHCIRHSYAVFLLRSGIPLKTIGDLLGHRSTESTSMYLRLAIEDLRDVALPVPTIKKNDGTEVRR
jgi:integrase/recombinase XerD